MKMFDVWLNPNESDGFFSIEGDKVEQDVV